MYALMVFKVFQKLFTTLYIINFLFASLKLLTETYSNPPQISLLCDWSMFSSADLSLAAGKILKNSLVRGGFRYEFTESQAASCKHLQC